MTRPTPASRLAAPRYSKAAALLVALNVAVWLLQLARGVPWLHPTSTTLIAWGGNLPLYTLTGDGWRLLTGMFLHGGALHLGLNMLALAATADRTADEYGTLRMLVIYVAGGLLASCASVLSAEWHARGVDTAALVTVSVGASGAVMAQFGALLVALVVTPPRFVPLPPDKRPAMDLGLVVVVAANLGLGLFFKHVDQSAHVGGLVGGMAVGLLMAMVPTATRLPATVLRYAATALLVAGCIGALLHFAPAQRLVVLRAVWSSELAR